MYIPKEILVAAFGFALIKVIDILAQGKSVDAEKLIALVFSTSVIVITLVILKEIYRILFRLVTKRNNS